MADLTRPDRGEALERLTTRVQALPEVPAYLLLCMAILASAAPDVLTFLMDRADERLTEMTDLVPAEEIEQLVGARRHAQAHLGRAVSAEQTVYILHSQACKDTGIDLRACDYSRALDRGIDLVDWQHHQDQVVTLQHVHGFLMPDADGPDDVELLEVHRG